MIQISETAAKKIRTLMAKQGISEGGLRVGVKGGGCSGLSYTFAWDTAPRRLLLVPRSSPQADARHAGARKPLPRSEPQVSSRLLLQRVAAGAAREPRAIVVPERRISRAEESDRARGAPAGDRRPAAGE